MTRHRLMHGIPAFTIGILLSLSTAIAQDEPFRPEAGTFPPLEKALSYRGELVFVDHANRRGSLRIEGAGMYFRNAPHPFAMLPYGMVRYHGAPADLRDIPLGSVLHVRAFLPPDPQISSVPVLPVNNREKNAGYSGSGTAPAENHAILLEDEPSYCLRENKIWKLKEIKLTNRRGLITARRESRSSGDEEASFEAMTFDAATRIWRGRECLGVDDLIEEGIWPQDGRKSLDGQSVHLGITWKPTANDIFTRFHVSDIWLDDASLQRASRTQTETHRAFIRSRWMPAWVDAVEYGKFGRARIKATLFGGMDDALYDDFTKGSSAMMNSVENTLKHTHGAYGPSHMACRGPLLDVIRTTKNPPMGSSGIQIHFETDLIIEGIRPGRIVRVRAASWPRVNVPREEYLNDGSSSIDARFPTPAIFPKY